MDDVEDNIVYKKMYMKNWLENLMLFILVKLLRKLIKIKGIEAKISIIIT